MTKRRKPVYDVSVAVSFAKLVLARMEAEGRGMDPVACVSETMRAACHIAAVRPDFMRGLARWFAADGVERAPGEYEGVAERWVEAIMAGAEDLRRAGLKEGAG